MIGIVKSVDKSKSGKSWRVQIDGKYYGANFDSHLEDTVGKAIDFNYKSTDFGMWIESWAYAQPAPQAAAQTAAKAVANNAQVSIDRWYLSFVSNTVAHAIQVGVITSPSQISAWAKAAKEAAEALEM